MTEAEAIPFASSSLRGERVLVLSPHPDDEVIGCGGVVALNIRENREVRVVVATDGGEAIQADDRDAYREKRELECRRGLEAVGTASLEFLRFPDRHLAENSHDLASRLAAILREFRPDLVLVPSVVEIHPDHLALATAFCQLIESDPTLFSELAFAQVAFYEVSQPLRPNTLVDITPVADAKWTAISAHASQLEIRDYIAFARGLNAYRAMTLPAEALFAEAYYVVPLPHLHTTAIGQLRHAVGDARGILTVQESPLPISVIVRTKDRPALLAEALASIRATGYPAEVVVVNDGGADVGLPEGTTAVRHDATRGRSAAMNSGVAAAKNPFIAFLDDDDLFYPDHLAVLSTAAGQSQFAAWYSDGVSAFVRTGASGTHETESRLRLFAQDFDRDLLLIDNFIPLPTLLVRRDDYLSVGGFDPSFDLFEDWDFLIRLTQKGDFLHVPRITCEIRHIAAGASIVLATPEGSPEFRKAKLNVWKKHSALIDPNVFANAFERQKHRLSDLNSEAVEQRGRLHHVEIDVARLSREKGEILANLQSLHEMSVTQLARVRELEGFKEGIERTLALAIEEAEARRRELAAAHEQLAEAVRGKEEAERGRDEMQTTIRALYAEVQRLQSLLDMIYASKTWKLHTTLEKLRGRG